MEVGSSTLREAIVVELRDTCKALDETIKTCTMKNISLDNVIKDLTEEEGDKDIVWDEGNENNDTNIIVDF
jgi:hypothetical protein